MLCLADAHAAGRAGDVFLCHPFIVHTATRPHRGAGPRIIAQPAINAPGGFALDGSDPSPVAPAIVRGPGHRPRPGPSSAARAIVRGLEMARAG
ncbi:MAG TPA: hypothetical protein VFW50_01670 [Streptosporangiaceae bacterium]|nr:hypothetical protein [Streptosporangiaceae bacterium]